MIRYKNAIQASEYYDFLSYVEDNLIDSVEENDVIYVSPKSSINNSHFSSFLESNELNITKTINPELATVITIPYSIKTNLTSIFTYNVEKFFDLEDFLLFSGVSVQHFYEIDESCVEDNEVKTIINRSQLRDFTSEDKKALVLQDKDCVFLANTSVDKWSYYWSGASIGAMSKNIANSINRLYEIINSVKASLALGFNIKFIKDVDLNSQITKKEAVILDESSIQSIRDMINSYDPDTVELGFNIITESNYIEDPIPALMCLVDTGYGISEKITNRVSWKTFVNFYEKIGLNGLHVNLYNMRLTPNSLAQIANSLKEHYPHKVDAYESIKKLALDKLFDSIVASNSEILRMLDVRISTIEYSSTVNKEQKQKQEQI